MQPDRSGASPRGVKLWPRGAVEQDAVAPRSRWVSEDGCTTVSAHEQVFRWVVGCTGGPGVDHLWFGELAQLTAAGCASAEDVDERLWGRRREWPSSWPCRCRDGGRHDESPLWIVASLASCGSRAVGGASGVVAHGSGRFVGLRAPRRSRRTAAARGALSDARGGREWESRASAGHVRGQAAADRRRDGSSRRRSRSDSPPQTPNRIWWPRAYLRHSTRTSQPRHTFFASFVLPPFSGKKASGSVWAHSADRHQSCPAVAISPFRSGQAWRSGPWRDGCNERSRCRPGGVRGRGLRP